MEIIDQIGSYGYLGLFAACFLAATLIPFSSEAVVLLFLATGYASLPVFLVALVGNYLGAVVNYVLGKKGMEYLAKRMSSKEQHRLEKAQSQYGKWGVPVLFFSWVPIIGDPLTFAAGLLEVRFALFSFWVILGKAFRYIAIIWLVRQF